MRILVQRSLKSSVSVNGEITGKIDKGLVLFVGFTFLFRFYFGFIFYRDLVFS